MSAGLHRPTTKQACFKCKIHRFFLLYILSWLNSIFFTDSLEGILNLGLIVLPMYELGAICLVAKFKHVLTNMIVMYLLYFAYIVCVWYSGQIILSKTTSLASSSISPVLGTQPFWQTKRGWSFFYQPAKLVSTCTNWC